MAQPSRLRLSLNRQHRTRTNLRHRAGRVAQAAMRRSMLWLIDGLGWTRTTLLQRHGFRRTWVQTSVGPLHLLEAQGQGSGPTWIFIHGFASQAADWAGLLQEMVPHCRRLVAVDLPGHGRSPITAAGLNAETLTEAGVQAVTQMLAPGERCVLVGNSMGGLGAVRCAQRLPERVAGLVLLSPAGAPMASAELDALLEVFNVSSLPTALQFVDRLYVNGCRARHITALAVMAQLNQPALQELLRHYRTYPFLTDAEVANLPTCLLVWGAGDEFFPTSSKAFYSGALNPERTQVVTPPEFGHTPFLDRPQAVARIMLAWAQQQQVHLGAPPPSGRAGRRAAAASVPAPPAAPPA